MNFCNAASRILKLKIYFRVTGYLIKNFGELHGRIQEFHIISDE